MRIHKRVRNLTEPEQEQFETYLAKKVDSLLPALEANYSDPDSIHVYANIQKHHKHTAFAFELIIEMPRKRVVASETKHTITEVLDFATQRAERMLTKHFKKLQNPSRRQRSIRNMKSLSAEMAPVA